MAIRPALLLAATLAALAAAPLAAKPPAPVGAPDVYRERGVAICVAESTISGELTGDDLQAICGCAVDRFIDDRGATALRSLGSGFLRGAIANELAACTAELGPERANDGAGRAAAPPEPVPEAKPPVPTPMPVDSAAAAPEGARFDSGAWLRGLDIRARLAALPAWAWIAIGFLILLLFGALVRRRDDRRHLLGPPPSMRPRAAPRPRPFRLEL
ncbi:MAG TPA: hypothetical protein VMS43_00910 [Allosphingosinicella sp.]|nr:hypothetical protein [Allosphingosinicella sp.]